MSSDGSGSEADDPLDDAASLLREEGRQVIDSQLQTLRDTDRKALATARMIALILGLLLSALSLSETPTEELNNWLVGGGALLLLSLGIAVLTYSVDRPSFGVGPGYFDEAIAEHSTRDQIEGDLLEQYANWIEDNGADISSNSTYLLITQSTLIAGIGFIAYGIFLQL